MQIFKKIVILLILACISSACYRGEVRSLDKVLSDYRESFNSKKSGVNEEIADKLNTAVAAMEALVSSPNTEFMSPKLNQVANVLDELIYSANYTVRPAMLELSKQYRLLAEKKGLKKDELVRAVGVTPSVSAKREINTLKLLVARTYSLLASELETSRFKLAT